MSVYRQHVRVPIHEKVVGFTMTAY